jgi:hypothetical protein
MKTINKLTAFALLAALNFSLTVKADDIALPVINKPLALEEGTQRVLTEAQIAELLPWAKDSKNFLVDLLDNVKDLSATEKVDRLLDGIQSVVSDSATKNSELLMRYALNRALVVSNLLNVEMDADAVGTIDAKVRVLILSIKMALKYYDTDMNTISKKTTSPFASFGVDYFSFLTELNKSIFDASAEYNIQRTSLEWLQWDLYRDLTNNQYASQILKINNALKTFPAKKLSDAQSLSYIRQMKKISQQLNLLKKPETSKAQKNNGKYGSFYSFNYSRYLCYDMDKAGARLGTQSDYLDDQFCTVGYQVFYETNYKQYLCYNIDSAGHRIGNYSDYIDINKCVKSMIYKTIYSGEYSANKCYRVDDDGHRLGSYSDYVENRFCQ